MIRRIGIDLLTPGMFVVDLHRSWFDHGFWRTQFLVRDAATIHRLLSEGVSEVSIDTRRGLDYQPPVSPAPPPAPGRSLEDIVRSRQASVSVGEERRRAARLLADARADIGDLMQVARMGGIVEPARLEPLIRRMIESVRRNPDALVPMTRLKVEDYAGEHAVATASLIIALGHRLGVAEAEVERLALGTLVKDVGQLALDARLAAHGRLTHDERSQVQRHVEASLTVLDAPSRLEETSVAVILEHHERFDGSGYPYRRAGGDISLAGRMAAIVDAYDAMTSDRPYRAALSPVEALRQIFSQGGVQFDPALVATFVHTVGVYPVGTLVRLESGHLAVVQSQNDGNPLGPTVRVIYDTRFRKYVAPVDVDLSRTIGNHYGKIVQAEDYQRWGISPLRWHPA